MRQAASGIASGIDLGELARWKTAPKANYAVHDAVLQVCAAADQTPPFAKQILAINKRQAGRGGNDDEAPAWALTPPQGASVCRAHYNAAAGVFANLQTLRKAVLALLALSPKSLCLDIRPQSSDAVFAALYAALTATARLPAGGRKTAPPKIFLAGAGVEKAAAATQTAAVYARANTLTRALAKLPPSRLGAREFAQTAVALARAGGLRAAVYSAAKLRRLGAGALLAVGRGAGKRQPPALARLQYAPRGAKKRVTLVGKGICFDTGGVNVKPAVHMRGMAKDMAGAAAALAAALAAAELRLPLAVEAWLPIAENNIGEAAYRPDETTTAANGKSIEIVHTDAEGRLALADALALASAARTDAICTFATLTGTMQVALGKRMSGFFCQDAAWRKRAEAAALASGERLCWFPLPADYMQDLKSDIADIKQCAEKGEADHIHAALFLQEFIRAPRPPWCHLDLAAAHCEGGLGAAPGPDTGFGAVWAAELLRRYAQE